MKTLGFSCQDRVGQGVLCPSPLRSTTPRYPHPPQVERFPLPTTPGLLCKLQPSLDTSSPSDPLPPNPEATKSHLSYRRLRGVSWDREQASEPGSEGPIHCQSPAPRLGDTPPHLTRRLSRSASIPLSQDSPPPTSYSP